LIKFLLANEEATCGEDKMKIGLGLTSISNEQIVKATLVTLPSKGEVITLLLGARPKVINTSKVTSFGNSWIIYNITFHLTYAQKE